MSLEYSHPYKLSFPVVYHRFGLGSSTPALVSIIPARQVHRLKANLYHFILVGTMEILFAGFLFERICGKQSIEKYSLHVAELIEPQD
jgi:hypothetical protein